MAGFRPPMTRELQPPPGSARLAASSGYSGLVLLLLPGILSCSPARHSSEVCHTLSLCHSESADLNSPPLDTQLHFQPVPGNLPRLCGLARQVSPGGRAVLGRLPAHMPQIRIEPLGPARGPGSGKRPIDVSALGTWSGFIVTQEWPESEGK